MLLLKASSLTKRVGLSKLISFLVTKETYS